MWVCGPIGKSLAEDAGRWRAEAGNLGVLGIIGDHPSGSQAMSNAAGKRGGARAERDRLYILLTGCFLLSLPDFGIDLRSICCCLKERIGRAAKALEELAPKGTNNDTTGGGGLGVSGVREKLPEALFPTPSLHPPPFSFQTGVFSVLM